MASRARASMLAADIFFVLRAWLTPQLAGGASEKVADDVSARRKKTDLASQEL